MHEYTVTIGTDHPALPGHFPGRPIVPGVVILDEVIACVEEAYGPARVVAMPAVKFSAELGPGQAMTIRLSKARGLIRFECCASQGTLATGSLRLAADGDAM